MHSNPLFEIFTFTKEKNNTSGEVTTAMYTNTLMKLHTSNNSNVYKHSDEAAYK